MLQSLHRKTRTRRLTTPYEEANDPENYQTCKSFQAGKHTCHFMRANRLGITFSLKCFDTKEPRMVVKMRRQLSSDMSVMVSMLKWRSRRLVMGLRPPPGGPMAATNWVSMICLEVQGGLLSYQPCRGLACIASRLQIERHNRDAYCYVFTCNTTVCHCLVANDDLMHSWSSRCIAACSCAWHYFV